MVVVVSSVKEERRGKREGRRRENSYDRSASEARTGGDVINGLFGVLSLSTPYSINIQTTVSQG